MKTASKRTFWLGAMALGGIFACSNGKAGDAEGPADDRDAGATSIPSHSPSSSDAGPSTGDDHEAADSGPKTENADSGPSSLTDSKTCVAQANAHHSKSTLVYTRDGGKVDVESLTTLVTNSLHRDGNNVKVFLKASGASTYTPLFESGNILTSGASVSVPLPPNFTLDLGDTLRIDAYFDEDTMMSPAAPCYMFF
jgi:hypothetical protein